MTADYTKIIILDLHLDMLIGIHDREKKAAQRVLVNVEATLRTAAGPGVDHIEKTLDYEELAHAIRRIAEDGHIELVEIFAERIAGYCLDHPLVTAAKVIVEKPDILPAADAVGVEIFRVKN